MGRQRRKDRVRREDAIREARKRAPHLMATLSWKWRPCPAPVPYSSAIRPLEGQVFILDWGNREVDPDTYEEMGDAILDRGGAFLFPTQPIPTARRVYHITVGQSGLPPRTQRPAGIDKFFTERGLSDLMVKVDATMQRRLAAIPVAEGMKLAVIQQDEADLKDTRNDSAEEEALNNPGALKQDGPLNAAEVEGQAVPRNIHTIPRINTLQHTSTSGQPYTSGRKYSRKERKRMREAVDKSK